MKQKDTRKSESFHHSVYFIMPSSLPYTVVCAKSMIRKLKKRPDEDYSCTETHLKVRLVKSCHFKMSLNEKENVYMTRQSKIDCAKVFVGYETKKRKRILLVNHRRFSLPPRSSFKVHYIKKYPLLLSPLHVK